MVKGADMAKGFDVARGLEATKGFGLFKGFDLPKASDAAGLLLYIVFAGVVAGLVLNFFWVISRSVVEGLF